MLGILKVNAGISTDGSSEFSITLVDVQDRVYEVQIDDIAYAQLVGVIEESTGSETESPPEPAIPSLDLEEVPNNGAGQQLSPEKRAALAQALAGQPPQHVVEGDQQPHQVSMADVGFLDYSADMDDDEEEEIDPGEELAESEDDFAEPL